MELEGPRQAVNRTGANYIKSVSDQSKKKYLDFKLKNRNLTNFRPKKIDDTQVCISSQNAPRSICRAFKTNRFGERGK